jgi:hypothetical protein
MVSLSESGKCEISLETGKIQNTGFKNILLTSTNWSFKVLVLNAITMISLGPDESYLPIIIYRFMTRLHMYFFISIPISEKCVSPVTTTA